MRRARNVRTDSGGASEIKLSKGESALLNAASGESKTADSQPENARASAANKAERSSEYATRETSVSTSRKFISVGL